MQKVREILAAQVAEGQALLPDLVALVQQISRRLDLPPDHRGRSALPLEEAAAKVQEEVSAAYEEAERALKQLAEASRQQRSQQQ